MSDDVQDRLDDLEAELTTLQENALTEGGIEMAALRQLVWGLADGDSKDYDNLAQGVHNALDNLEALEERIDDLEAENETLRTRLDKLGDIGEQKTSKEQKVAAIVTYAENRRSKDQSALTVKPGTIKGLVDVSRRYAYDLVDDMVAEYDWAHDPRDFPRHIEQDAPQKGVCIDFEGVHGEPVPVNKFTTQSGGMGVAD